MSSSIVNACRRGATTTRPPSLRPDASASSIARGRRWCCATRTRSRSSRPTDATTRSTHRRWLVGRQLFLRGEEVPLVHRRVNRPTATVPRRLCDAPYELFPKNPELDRRRCATKTVAERRSLPWRTAMSRAPRRNTATRSLPGRRSMTPSTWARSASFLAGAVDSTAATAARRRPRLPLRRRHGSRQGDSRQDAGAPRRGLRLHRSRHGFSGDDQLQRRALHASACSTSRSRSLTTDSRRSSCSTATAQTCRTSTSSRAHSTSRPTPRMLSDRVV